MTNNNKRPFIAYTIQRFPALRTTFVRREIEALRELGLPIEIVSMRRPNPEELGGERETEQYLSSTHYLPQQPVDIPSVLANVRSMFSKPSSLMRNLGYMIGDAGTSGVMPRVRLCLQVWRSAVLAEKLSQIGDCRHVHSPFTGGSATTAMVCAELLGITFSFQSHAAFNPPLLREKLNNASFIFSISEYCRDKLVHVGGESCSDRIHVVHCGIPLSRWDFSYREQSTTVPLIVSVGALYDMKGHDTLIAACHKLLSNGRDLRCEIIGDGLLRDQLHSQIISLGIQDKVRLLGPLAQEVVQQKLREADAFILACKPTVKGDTDGIPVSLMEAMAVGVPVVSTYLSGIPELITDKVTGHLAQPGDANSLAKAICCALSRDKDTRRTMCHQARMTIEDRFNQQKEAATMAGIIRSHVNYK